MIQLPMHPHLVDGMLFWGISSLGYGMMSRAFGANVAWIFLVGDFLVEDIFMRFRHVVLPYRLTRILIMFVIGLAGQMSPVETVLCGAYAVVLLWRSYLQASGMLTSTAETLFLVAILTMYIAEGFEILARSKELRSALDEYMMICT
jgi:hypothetical protein